MDTHNDPYVTVDTHNDPYVTVDTHNDPRHPIQACHLFRHSMAMQMREHHADMRYVQAMLGHEDLDSTQIYTHLSIAKLQAAHAATHPAAKLGWRSADQEDDQP